MENSKHFNFQLPSSDSDDVADINVISDNFRTIDTLLNEQATKKQDKFAEVDANYNLTLNAYSPTTQIRGGRGGAIAFDNSSGAIFVLTDYGVITIDSKKIQLSDLGVAGVKTPTEDDEAANKGYVDEQIETRISTALKREIVNELPAVSEAETNIVYMVPAKEASEDNYYNEYLKIVSAGNVARYELIGSSKCDLSEYATLEYVNNLIGDIDTALENIITLQQDYIRGESV